jgi:hypothetical protein
MDVNMPRGPLFHPLVGPDSTSLTAQQLSLEPPHCEARQRQGTKRTIISMPAHECKHWQGLHTVTQCRHVRHKVCLHSTSCTECCSLRSTVVRPAHQCPQPLTPRAPTRSADENAYTAPPYPWALLPVKVRLPRLLVARGACSLHGAVAAGQGSMRQTAASAPGCADMRAEVRLLLILQDTCTGGLPTNTSWSDWQGPGSSHV